MASMPEVAMVPTQVVCKMMRSPFEWSETAASKLTQEMNAAPTKFDKWQPDIPFMQAIKRAVIKAIANL